MVHQIFIWSSVLVDIYLYLEMHPLRNMAVFQIVFWLLTCLCFLQNVFLGGKANWVICKRLWKKIELAIPILTLNYILHKLYSSKYMKKKKSIISIFKIWLVCSTKWSMSKSINNSKSFQYQHQNFLKSCDYRYGKAVVCDSW